MADRILLFTTSIFFLAGAFLFTDHESYAQSYSKTIIGQVTLVGDRMLKIKEDGTQIEYLLKSKPDKLVHIITGYRVEVKASDGDVSSISILGMPMKAEPRPFQKWTVIIRPSE